MKIGAATCVGLIRDQNEDCFWYKDNIFVVCDGMGGHQGGEVASSLAIQAIRDFSFKSDDPLDEIEEAITQAHLRIQQEADSRGIIGMGTTITMNIIDNKNTLFVGHVGDSRCYIARNDELIKLTTDHSLVGELLRNGSLSEHEASIHPHRHMLTQALGVGDIQVQKNKFDLDKQDKILLCTDGLTNVVDENDILTILLEYSPQDAADKLIKSANNSGGPDNITVLVVHC